MSDEHRWAQTLIHGKGRDHAFLLPPPDEALVRILRHEVVLRSVPVSPR